jgi:hypothetical protein
MSFINKLRAANSLTSSLTNTSSTNAGASAARPAHALDPRVPPVPLHAPARTPGRPGEETSGRFSNGLKEFLWQIEDIGRGSLLDLGAVSQATVTYFIERNFKVYTEDLLAAWGAFLEQDSKRAQSLPAGAEQPDTSPAARADRFLASNLRYPADSFDAVLLWDALDYMDREAAQQFLARITSLVRDGGAILAIFHTRPPEQFQRYRVLDAHTLQLVPVPTLVQPRHVYQNREIQELFEKFRTSKTFVSRDQLREGVFVK